MDLSALREKARGKVVEIVVTFLFMSVIGVLGFAAKAYAEGIFFTKIEFSQFEMRHGLGDIAKEIKELDYKIRAATLDLQTATARNDAIAMQRAQSDVLYFTSEKEALEAERRIMLQGS